MLKIKILEAVFLSNPTLTKETPTISYYFEYSLCLQQAAEAAWMF